MSKLFGPLFRAARKKAGHTLEAMADRIGVSAAYLSRVERGECPPMREHHIITAAEILGVEPDDFLRAAVNERSEAPAFVKPNTVETYSFLLRRLNSLTDSQLARIEEILHESVTRPVVTPAVSKQTDYENVAVGMSPGDRRLGHSFSPSRRTASKSNGARYRGSEEPPPTTEKGRHHG